MEIQEIDVLIEKDGRVSVSVRGVMGPKCLALTQDLEKTLGGEVLSRVMTSEAAAISEEEVPQRQRLSA
jgi:hypothetical protein